MTRLRDQNHHRLKSTDAPQQTSNRRRFLSLGVHLFAGAVLPSQASVQTGSVKKQISVGDHPYNGVSASGRSPAEFALASTNQQQAGQLTSSFRGHGLAQYPLNPDQVVMVGRRPGRQAMFADSRTGDVIQTFYCASNRYFCGHACFNQDGRWLYCSQADSKTHQGSIAVFDSQTGQLVAEWPSHGIEPHELVFDQLTHELVIANGGLVRSQDGQRRLLNRDSMSSSLVRLNASSGQKLEQIIIKQPYSSLRHLAIGADQTISLAIQYQAEDNRLTDEVWLSNKAAAHAPYLTATYHPKIGIKPFSIPQRIWEVCQGYIGSTAICASQNIAAFTSPRGNLALFWDTRQHNLLSIYRFNDVCGVSTTPDEGYFALTNSHGSVRFIDTQTQQENLHLRQKFPHQSWDNHLLMIPQTQPMMSL